MTRDELLRKMADLVNEFNQDSTRRHVVDCVIQFADHRRHTFVDGEFHRMMYENNPHAKLAAALKEVDARDTIITPHKGPSLLYSEQDIVELGSDVKVSASSGGEVYVGIENKRGFTMKIVPTDVSMKVVPVGNVDASPCQVGNTVGIEFRR